MTEHVHEWEPAPNVFMRYQCACGATGYRSTVDGKGQIVAHKRKRNLKEKEIVQVGSGQAIGGSGSGNYRHGKRGPGSY